MKYFCLTFLFFGLSCANSDNFVTEKEFKELPREDASLNRLCEPKEEMWVCHNPHSPIHGKECTSQCYAAGENSKFCWHLHRLDCRDNVQPHEWQREYCPQLDICD